MNPDTSPVLCPAPRDSYEELLIQWNDDAFFEGDEDSIAAVYAEEISR